MYYLITDISTQWFSYIICFDNEKVKESHDLREINNIESFLLYNIYNREIHFSRRSFNINGSSESYYGWSISKHEFELIKRLIEYKPIVDLFNKIKDCK